MSLNIPSDCLKYELWVSMCLFGLQHMSKLGVLRERFITHVEYLTSVEVEGLA